MCPPEGGRYIPDSHASQRAPVNRPVCISPVVVIPAHAGIHCGVDPRVRGGDNEERVAQTRQLTGCLMSAIREA